jgi:hypothetical protein
MNEWRYGDCNMMITRHEFLGGDEQTASLYS